MNKNPKIIFSFNFILFFFWCVNTLIIQLFEPESEKRVPWDLFYDTSPAISIVVGVLIVFLMILWGSKLIQLFWNKFISDVFKLRMICFQEALTLALILSLITI